MISDDFTPLPGGAWRIWRGIVLRSAGFPVRWVERLADPMLAHTADIALKSAVDAGRRRPHRDDLVDYHGQFTAAATRIGEAIRTTALDPRFREAVMWQNPRFVGTCLDRVSRPRDRRDSRLRTRESAVASYLQRYATKNDSIGFFGPIGWASWETDRSGLSVMAGPGLLSRRSVYFESWAIDAVAAAFADRAELRHGVPPRRVPANSYHDDHVLLPTGTRQSLTADEAAILRGCDGVRTVREIASGVGCPEEQVLERLRGLCGRDLVRMDLGGPIEAYPERRLRERLSRVPWPPARQRALADLDRLVRAKDRVAAAAGHPHQLAVAFGALESQFERLTRRAAQRAPGQAYAARTIVFEDTVRDVAVGVGADILRALGEPLSLVLASGRWLAARIGRDYLARLDGYYERKRQRAGADQVPLAGVLALATRDFYTARGVPAAAAAAVAELQRRWAAIIQVPHGVRRHTVAVDDIAGRVREEFASDPPRWSGALHHSPDVMIAAESADAVGDGDFQLVLGELHLAFNTVESRALVEQSPDRGRLLAMAEAAVGGGRVVPVAPREWGCLTRTSPPPALLSPRYVYWAPGADDVCDLPGEAIPLSGLEVYRASGDLAVRYRADGRTFPLAEVVGEYLSRVVVSAFRMLPRRRYTPRVSIGRLVVARESWSLPPRTCDWAYQLDERTRYLQMRQWVARYGMSRRAFYSVSVETKPIYVDFTSLALTNNLAAAIRRLARDGSDGDVSIAEMLPDAQGCWLTDRADGRYVSELRMVVSERAG